MAIKSPTKWMTPSLLLFAGLSAASFMAMGPPAAPDQMHAGSALELDQQYRMMDFDHVERHVTRYTNTSISTAPEVIRNASIIDPSVVERWGNDMEAAAASYWWLADKKFGHKQPYAGKGYKVFRNVKDYGASGDGFQDDAPFIMKAIMDGNRCGANCNATSTKGAIIYFPPGRYRIRTPILQYYYTVFIGDPNNPPTIVGAKDFKGIALIDTNFYIPKKKGEQWWTNQNNFYRQIRNFKIDMTDMPSNITDGAVDNWPVGIHWQVSQACTLQNIQIVMPLLGQGKKVEHRGIFMENGSGGFVSEISMVGGKVGFVAGNQQYTARRLKFTSCERAIDMLWDWGFTWKSLDVTNCNIGINATATGVDKNTKKNQGTGTLTIMDSEFKKVEKMLIVGVNVKDYQPTVVVDNVRVDSVMQAAVSDKKGKVLLGGGAREIKAWGLGRRFTDDEPNGDLVIGSLQPTKKDPSLLHGEDWKFYEHDKPQYQHEDSSSFLNVLDFGVKNDGTSPSTNVKGISDALKDAADQKKILVFPAGVYKVDDTLFIPPGTRMVGALWSQIMATGKGFSDPWKTKVLAKVGNPGDKGMVEISDMMFTHEGATAGTIFIEWNIHEDQQGSAAMWDTIVRVGGAVGTGLLESTCHHAAKQEYEKCMASTMMLHVTASGSIYVENSWFWVADHDVDSKEQTRVNVYGARGILVESRGPSWFYSVSNEHSTLYNWQLNNARNVFLGHIQSETPYFQAGQTISTKPYTPGSQTFAEDPEFPDCAEDAKGLDTCQEAWALRIINSRNVYLYGGGFYSFFKDYKDDCAKFGKICQDKIIDIDRSEGIWLYNLFTVGAKEIVSPQGLEAVPRQNNVNGFATATSSWTLLANKGADIGGTRRSKLQKHEEDEDSGEAPCDFHRDFNSLEDLEKEVDKLSSYCRNIHLMQIISKMITDAVDKYSKVENNYDGLFEKYSKVFRSWMESEFSSFMSGPGKEYFTCEHADTKGRKTRARCDDKSMDLADYINWELDFTLDDKEGFYAALAKDKGIDEAWLDWPPAVIKHGESSIVNKQTGFTTPTTHTLRGYPKLKDKFPVPDPKEIFTTAMPNIEGLQQQLAATHLEMKMAMYSEHDPSDAVQVYSVPAFLMTQAIENMEQVRKIGEEVKKEERKNLILTILTAVFAVVPFVGELGALAAGLTTLARIIGVAGFVGNTALSIADAVEHPEMAPLAIVGILLGGLPGGRGGRNARTSREDMKNMAKLRAGITGDVTKGLGKVFVRNDALLQRTIGVCMRR